MKKTTLKNRGFTLLELLGTISLISIIAVLVISKLSSTINESKEANYYASSTNLVNSLESYYFEQKMTKKFTGCNYNFETSDNNCSNFKFTGEKPTAGTITMDENGNINGIITFNKKYNYQIEDNYIIRLTNPGDIGKEYVYDYTGTIETFTAKYTGNYKLEVWGAQGGSTSNAEGGYGGYATGEIHLTRNQKIYIVVGGQGESGSPGQARTLTGGYNGGGNGYMKDTANAKESSGGGGATHISLKKKNLSNLKNDLESIIIVAGGGGGNYNDNDGWGYSALGGSGGGIIGSKAQKIEGSCNNNCAGNTPTGGTQENGGFGITSYASGNQSSTSFVGTFGLGGTGDQSYGGGGGGLYGGASGNYQAGAGGSGYISNQLTNAKMYCYKCTSELSEETTTYEAIAASNEPKSNQVKQKNGYVKITYLGN